MFIYNRFVLRTNAVAAVIGKRPWLHKYVHKPVLNFNMTLQRVVCLLVLAQVVGHKLRHDKTHFLSNHTKESLFKTASLRHDRAHSLRPYQRSSLYISQSVRHFPGLPFAAPCCSICLMTTTAAHNNKV